MITTCPSCLGQGSVVEEPCPQCDGAGRSPQKRQISVKIPAGIHDGQAVRVRDEGEPGDNGGPRGDLHVYVRVQQHEFFQRDENDLVMHLPITFTQAALGADVEVPTLFGKSNLRIPPGTQHGQVLSLKGLGLPSLRGGANGSQHVQVLIEVPRKLTRKQEEILRDYAAEEETNVLPAQRVPRKAEGLRRRRTRRRENVDRYRYYFMCRGHLRRRTVRCMQRCIMPQDEPQKSGPDDNARNAGDGQIPSDLSPDLIDAEGMEKAAAELDDLRSRLARWQADFQNLQRRTAREILEARQRAEGEFAKSLLSVLDHFDLALNVDPAKVDSATLLNGVKITYDELTKVLAARGIESFDPVGQPFDPHQHEAIMQEATDKVPPMTVLQTLQAGYRLGDWVLRPAKVKVSAAKG